MSNPAEQTPPGATDAETVEQELKGRAALTLRKIAADGSAEMIESAARPDILEVADNMGSTALHRAAENGNAEAVRALLRLGANPNALNCHWRTPCAAAIHSNASNAETARLLAEAMAPDEDLMGGRRDIDRLTLVIAAQCGKLDIVKMLLPKAENPLSGESLKIRKAAASAARRGGWPQCEQWIRGWLAAETEAAALKKTVAKAKRASEKEKPRGASNGGSALGGVAANGMKKRPKAL
jgi:hypothetical protein